jgi:hypothetical protein
VPSEFEIGGFGTIRELDAKEQLIGGDTVGPTHRTRPSPIREGIPHLVPWIVGRPTSNDQREREARLEGGQAIDRERGLIRPHKRDPLGHEATQDVWGPTLPRLGRGLTPLNLGFGLRR